MGGQCPPLGCPSCDETAGCGLAGADPPAFSLRQEFPQGRMRRGVLDHRLLFGQVCLRLG